MAPDFLCATLSTLHAQHCRVVAAYAFAPPTLKIAMNSQNGKCPDIHRNSAFLTRFSFVLGASAVDTHAAYENESSLSTPTRVSSRPS
jgi:hypothetical protein